MIRNPTFMPKSIRFEYINTSNTILESNPEILGLCVKAKMVLEEPKENFELSSGKDKTSR